MATVEPQASLPPSPSSSALSAEPVYVDVMSGHFTLTDAPVPPGAPAPTSESLAIVLNANTGHVLNIAITPSLPSVSELGPTIAATN